MLLTVVLVVVGIIVIVFFIRGLRENMRRRKQGASAHDARLLVEPFLDPPKTRFAVADSRILNAASADGAPFFPIGESAMFLVMRGDGGERFFAASESSVLPLPSGAGEVAYDGSFKLTAANDGSVILNGAAMKAGVPCAINRGDWLNIEGDIGEFF